MSEDFITKFTSTFLYLAFCYNLTVFLNDGFLRELIKSQSSFHSDLILVYQVDNCYSILCFHICCTCQEKNDQ